MNRKRFAFSTAFLVIGAAALMAQRPAHRIPPTTEQMVARQVTHLTAALTLTTAQQAQATTIFTTEHSTMDAIHTSLETAHTALETAVKANNAAGINAAANQIGNLTTQQVVAHATAQAALYEILTPDQKTKSNGIRPGFRRGGPGGGPSGVMPMHGGPAGFGPGR